MKKILTWDDLADLYDKRTGGTARIKPLEEVYKWGVKQKDIIESKKGLILKVSK